MAETFEILDQTAPAAATLTDAYTAGTAAVISAIYVCNRDATATTFRISVAKLGAVDSVEQYLYYDQPIPGHETFEFGPLGLVATDVIRVYATLATVTFTITGLEIT